MVVPLPGHVPTTADPQIGIWRRNALELSQPREAPQAALLQEDAAALRPGPPPPEGRASLSGYRRRARRPTAYRKRRSPPPPPGQSAGKPPTTAAGRPRERRRTAGEPGRPQHRPPPHSPHRLGLPASEPARGRRPDGQGWAGQRPTALTTP